MACLTKNIELPTTPTPVPRTIAVVSDIICVPGKVSVVRESITINPTDTGDIPPRSILELIDVGPSSFKNAANRTLIVNAEETAIEFGPIRHLGDGAISLLDLSDAPSTFGGNAYALAIVSGEADKLKFLKLEEYVTTSKSLVLHPSSKNESTTPYTLLLAGEEVYNNQRRWPPNVRPGNILAVYAIDTTGEPGWTIWRGCPGAKVNTPFEGEYLLGSETPAVMATRMNSIISHLKSM